ncbi:hypothetical protein ABXT46_02560 [Candidatus Pelagibacter sp. Uisw_104]|uniref:hypothetical protein n=1 Tax=Candidatus Pelagibacter sp. Uisw_104 TaxID=3230983 RepID=UPI0039EB5D03
MFNFINNLYALNEKSLSMTMVAVGLSTGLKDLRTMGYKLFVVGFIAMVTVGLVSIITMKIFTEVFINL